MQHEKGSRQNRYDLNQRSIDNSLQFTAYPLADRAYGPEGRRWNSLSITTRCVYAQETFLHVRSAQLIPTQWILRIQLGERIT